VPSAGSVPWRGLGGKNSREKKLNSFAYLVATVSGNFSLISKFHCIMAPVAAGSPDKRVALPRSATSVGLL